MQRVEGERIMIRHPEELWDVIGSIYDAAFEPAGWPQTLSRLTERYRALGAVPSVCGAARAACSDACRDGESAIFAALLPHLARAARIRRRLWELDLRDSLASAGIDGRQRVVLVDARSRVLFATDSAAKLIGDAHPFRLRSGVLSALDPAADTQLHCAVARCLKSRLLVHAGGELTIQRDARSAFHVLIVPFASRGDAGSTAWYGGRRPAALVLISDPDEERRARKQRLQERFRLTPAEADVALELLQGDGRDAAAARLGIAPGTVRTHLQRVFEKTGVHRQAELLMLIIEPNAGSARDDTRLPGRIHYGGPDAHRARPAAGSRQSRAERQPVRLAAKWSALSVHQ
jgi:DNA-binding CsgD family transcriptional regulator